MKQKPPMALTLILCLILGFLAACQVKQPSQTPKTSFEMPGKWVAPKALTGSVKSQWWFSFKDQNLTALVSEALKNNPDLQKAASRVQAAQAQAIIAGADLIPHLDAGASAAKSKQISSTTEKVTRTSRLGVSLDLSWEVDLWGRIRSGQLAAQENVETVRAELEGAGLSLVGQTSKAWFAVIETQLQINLAKDTVANHKSTAQVVRQRYEEGLKPALDLRLALSNLARSKAILVQRRLNHERAIRQLEILLGRYPAGAIKSIAQLPAMPGPAPAGLPAELLGRRSDLMAARHQILAAGARLAEAEAALLPRIQLTAAGGTTSNALRELVDIGTNGIWNLVANLVQPLVDGGRLRAGVDLRKAEYKGILADYAGALLTALQEVENALVAEQFLTMRETALKSYAEQALAARDLAENRYQKGLQDFTTVLTAQISALEAQSQLLAIKLERLTNRIDLHLALGGGFLPGSRFNPAGPSLKNVKRKATVL